MRALVMMAVLFGLSGSAWAVAFDGMQVGQMPASAVAARVAKIKERAADSRIIDIASPGARASMMYGLASVAVPLGELGAELLAAAVQGNTLVYIRYHVPQERARPAIEKISTRYRGVVFEAAASEETGPSDWFFVSPIDVTWIRSGPDEKLEIIVATHEVIKTILLEDLRAPEWAQAIEVLRARSAAAR